MKNQSQTEKDLFEKLQNVENGGEVMLTPKEAILYRIDVSDILPDDDWENENVGFSEKEKNG